MAKKGRKQRPKEVSAEEVSALAFQAAYGEWVPAPFQVVQYGASGPVTFWRILRDDIEMPDLRCEVQVVMLAGRGVVERIDLARALPSIDAAIHYCNDLEHISIL